MAKTLRTAALIIGATAAVVATAGALAPAATAAFLGSAGITAGTIAGTSALAATLGLVSAGFSAVSGIVARKPQYERVRPPPVLQRASAPGPFDMLVGASA